MKKEEKLEQRKRLKIFALAKELRRQSIHILVEELLAIARTKRHEDQKKIEVLFVCKNNQFRSQMAAAIYNQITGTKDAGSAGTYVGSDKVPEGTVIEGYFRTPDFFELMEENGMNIRNNRTKKLVPEMVESARTVVSIVQEPFIPDFLHDNKKVIRWEIADPAFATREVAEKTYSQIKRLVEQLIATTSE